MIITDNRLTLCVKRIEFHGLQTYSVCEKKRVSRITDLLCLVQEDGQSAVYRSGHVDTDAGDPDA